MITDISRAPLVNTHTHTPHNVLKGTCRLKINFVQHVEKERESSNDKSLVHVK